MTDLKGDVWATSLQKMGIVVWEMWHEKEGCIIFKMANFGGSFEIKETVAKKVSERYLTMG